MTCHAPTHATPGRPRPAPADGTTTRANPARTAAATPATPRACCTSSAARAAPNTAPAGPVGMLTGRLVRWRGTPRSRTRRVLDELLRRVA
jgi:hypothetical protein